jgi:hypothetical protein
MQGSRLSASIAFLKAQTQYTQLLAYDPTRLGKAECCTWSWVSRSVYLGLSWVVGVSSRFQSTWAIVGRLLNRLPRSSDHESICFVAFLSHSPRSAALFLARTLRFCFVSLQTLVWTWLVLPTVSALVSLQSVSKLKFARDGFGRLWTFCFSDSLFLLSDRGLPLVDRPFFVRTTGLNRVTYAHALILCLKRVLYADVCPSRKSGHWTGPWVVAQLVVLTVSECLRAASLTLLTLMCFVCDC